MNPTRWNRSRKGPRVVPTRSALPARHAWKIRGAPLQSTRCALGQRAVRGMDCLRHQNSLPKMHEPSSLYYESGTCKKPAAHPAGERNTRPKIRATNYATPRTDDKELPDAPHPALSPGGEGGVSPGEGVQGFKARNFDRRILSPSDGEGGRRSGERNSWLKGMAPDWGNAEFTTNGHLLGRHGGLRSQARRLFHLPRI